MVASALLLLWDERQIAEFYWKSYSADICGALLMPQRLKPEAHSDVLKGASLDCSHGGKPHTHTPVKQQYAVIKSIHTVVLMDEILNRHSSDTG